MADLLATPDASQNYAEINADALKSVGITSKDDLEVLIDASTAYASAHGLLVGSTKCSGQYTHAPLSLLPVAFPKALFDNGVKLSPLYAKLVDAVSRDSAWLRQSLAQVVQHDSFTKNLLDIFIRVIEEEGGPQKTYLGLLRSDYMLHYSNNDNVSLKQVELNTIASSFGCLGTLTSNLHQYVSQRFDFNNDMKNLPDNPAMTKLSFAMAKAHEHYGDNSAVIVFIVQPGEVNSVDQRLLEYTLWDNHRIKVVRKTLLEISNESIARVLNDKSLYLQNEESRVSVVYFRAGYAPTDYPTASEWSGRMKIEKSRSIKCPSIAYHLVGTKKVQQRLAAPGELEKFMTNEAECLALRESFAGLYSLGMDTPDETREIIEKVRANPQNFVLKPQREGGGNNLYGNDIVEAFDSLTSSELESYIIMSKICPKASPAILLRDGTPIIGNCISELGLYAIGLFDDGKELLNEHAGHLLRTKSSDTNEGGVASGFAVLSSPLLTL